MGKQSNQKRIRLVLLCDRVLLRESLVRLLASEPDFELVAECATPQEALEELGGTEVDVIPVDLGIAKEFIPRVRKAGYDAKSLVVAREIDIRGSAIVLKCGASGIFMESDCSARLIQATRLVATGNAWVDQKVIQFLADQCPNYEDRWCRLTQKEQAVLKGIVDGLSNREIGANIGVSETTTKSIVQRLFGKAGVRTRSQLVRIALEGPPLGIPKATDDFR